MDFFRNPFFPHTWLKLDTIGFLEKWHMCTGDFNSFGDKNSEGFSRA